MPNSLGQGHICVLPHVVNLFVYLIKCSTEHSASYLYVLTIMNPTGVNMSICAACYDGMD